MDRLVHKHHQSMKLLEKTLDEISTNQRKTEEKLNRQCRDLGLDLTQLRRSSRDLDDIQDMTPRLSSRRGSLPQIAEFTKSPRSQRRLSIAAIPVTPTNNKIRQDRDDKRINAPGASKKASAPEANKSVLPVETQNNIKKNNSVPSERKVGSSITGGGGINKQHVLPKIDRQDYKEDSVSDKGYKQRTATVLINHEDVAGTSSSNGIGVGKSNGSGNAIVVVDEEEEEMRRLFNSSRGRGRRASEPTISKHSFDALQNGLGGVGAKAHGDDEKLKQVAHSNHHLEIVSEQDETELEAAPHYEAVQATETAKNFSGGPPASQGQGYSRQRRKSEGDILKWTQHLSKQQGIRGERKELSYQTEPANNEVWDSVRKCRYIRGYDPPEMIQPEDVNKFVFGNGK